MRIVFTGWILAAVALVGCDQMNTDRTTAPLPETSPPATTTTDPATGAPVTTDSTPGPDSTPGTSVDATGRTSPDNTAVNERDAVRDTKTPIDQDENQADVNLTAEIRKRLLDQPDMSVNARNAKIITSQGKVTLRGPVDSEAERDALVKIATEIAGAENVDNQLEVVPAQP
jgi:hyperosmotically inducible protein